MTGLERLVADWNRVLWEKRVVWAVGLAVIVTAIWFYDRLDLESTAEKVECVQDIECVRKRTDWLRDAERYCAPPIEDQAMYSYRWTNGLLENKLEWVVTLDEDEDSQRVLYMGRKLEFQNEFGVYQRMSYQCLYDPINKRLHQAIVEPYNSALWPSNQAKEIDLESTAEKAECMQDIECVRKRTDWLRDAERFCAPAIEDQAMYSYRWTHDLLENKFERLGEDDDSQGVLYMGRKLEFQNESGVYQRMSYWCDYDPINKKVHHAFVVPYNMVPWAP